MDDSPAYCDACSLNVQELRDSDLTNSDLTKTKPRPELDGFSWVLRAEQLRDVIYTELSE
jgi:hypothetical protein